MWRVARKTTLIGFHGSVLEDERPHRVRVTLGTNRKLTGGGSHLVTGLGAMRVVAVAALDKSNIDTMPVGPREFRLLRGMATVAQGSLRFRQQKIDIGRAMRTVTGRTADTIGQVFRVGKVLRFQAGLVALRTDRRRLGGTQRFKTNDLGGVAAAVNMGLRRTVTSLTSMLTALEQRRVRRVREVLVPYFLVAGLANVGVGVLDASRSGERGGCLRSRVTWVLLCSYRDGQAASHEKCQCERKECSAFAVNHPRPTPISEFRVTRKIGSHSPIRTATNDYTVANFEPVKHIPQKHVWSKLHSFLKYSTRRSHAGRVYKRGWASRTWPWTASRKFFWAEMIRGESRIRQTTCALILEEIC